MRTVYANDYSSVKIYGNHSPWPVIVDMEVFTQFGDAESAFHAVKALQPFLPVQPNETYPLDAKKLQMACDNQARGERYWQYRKMTGERVKDSTGYDMVRGFGHAGPNDEFVFINTDTGQPVYHIRGVDYAVTN